MSDRAVVSLAAAAWAGALLASAVPVVVVAVAVVAAAFARHVAIVGLALLALTSLLAHRGLAGLEPSPAGAFEGVVAAVTDPEPTTSGGLRFEVTTGADRLLADVVSPTATEALRRRLAGDRFLVRGRTTPFPRRTAWTTSRHLAGRLHIESVVAVGPGSSPAALANRFRRLLDDGARSLPPDRQALLAGLVLGDDRAQPAELTADFRAAGLTHLLAVSGQNVMLVIVLAGPLLRRLRIWPRYLAAIGLVAAFALVTRFEPSVTRAAFVAGVALFARTTGRPSGGVRHLALAVCLLLVVDPLLVHSLGFRLSVAASAGVLLLAPPVSTRLPGPRWFREGLGVTAGAQLAVAPVLVPVLGPMPLAALPANVLAGPLAGALMMWGLTAGSLAGLLGGRAAAMLHLPSGAGLAVMEQVASVGASLPMGQVDLRHLAVLAAGVVVVRAASRRDAPSMLALGGVLVVGALLAPLVTPVRSGVRPAGFDATVWVDGPVAVVDVGPRADPVAVVEELRAAEVVSVGLVVVRTSRSSAAHVVDAVAARFPVGTVLAPPGLAVRDAVVPPAGLRLRVRRLLVSVDGAGPPMRVRIGWAPLRAGRAPAGRRGHRR